ncbi:hypothetical protein D3C78_823590 [compost metagenome]
MLQHPRACQRTFLGDMTDEEDRRAALLGVTHQQRGALTHLGDTARRRLQLLGENGLDRIDHHDLGLFHPGSGDDCLDAGFGHYPQLILGQSQAPGTHRHLLLGFFAGDIQCWHARSDGAQGLQENGRLADTRVATDQYHRTVNQATAQYPVQLGAGGAEARDLFDADLGQGLDLRLLPGPAGAATGRRCSAAFQHGLDQGVPGPALTALAGPFRKGRAALGAAVHALGLGHGGRSSEKGTMIADLRDLGGHIKRQNYSI